MGTENLTFFQQWLLVSNKTEQIPDVHSSTDQSQNGKAKGA